MGLFHIINRYPRTLGIFHIRNKTEDLLKLLLPNSETLADLSNDSRYSHQFQKEMASAVFHRSIHGISTNVEDSNVDEEEKLSAAHKQIIKNAEEICKLISAESSNPVIETALVNLTIEIEVSPDLVLEVLKRLTNAGVLALAFFRWAEKQKGFKHTTDCYNALIDSLGKIKQFNLIWVLVESMKGKDLLTKDTFMLIIRRYARAKKGTEAVQAFKKMETFGLKPDLSDSNRFLDTLCKSRQVKKAQEVFDKMSQRGFSPDNKTYSILLQGWGQERDLSKLDEVYNQMKSEGFEPDTVAYGILMNAYCKGQRIDIAVEMFHEMQSKNCELSPLIYCTLIHGFGSAKRLGEALKLFEMSKASGVMTEAPTYNAVVGSYCWSLKFDDAYKTIDEMRAADVGPNSRTYDIILHHLIKAQRLDEACEVFRRMRNEKGCQPILSTYEIMLRMFCNKGEMRKAVNLWNQMKSQGILPNMHMFSTLINRFCHEKKLEDACKYFEEMLDVGIRPPGPLFSHLKQSLIAGGKKDTFVSLSHKLSRIRSTPIEG
ncbi:hypothetical protein V2J09_003550 [Rumex salicifolius]